MMRMGSGNPSAAAAAAAAASAAASLLLLPTPQLLQPLAAACKIHTGFRPHQINAKWRYIRRSITVGGRAPVFSTYPDIIHSMQLLLLRLRAGRAPCDANARAHSCVFH
jgi:hypothetical protein